MTAITADAIAFRAARDHLLTHRGDPAKVGASFRWPRLTQFNWALDHFDRLAREDGDAPALWIVNEGAGEQKISYARMAARSNQVANWLRGLGVRRGDRMLLMLGNEVALWETMLAAFKLGAVVIPASALLTPADLRDRIERGHVRHVVAGEAHAPKFESVAGDYTRIVVGAAQPGWTAFDASRAGSDAFTPDGPTQATDPLLLYFTSGTTSKPKLVLHTHQSYPVGHLSTMFWIGLKPGDIHMNISSPGWAKHAWSCFFAPWNAGACIFMHNVARFAAPSLLETMARCQVNTLCAPPTVWRMLIQEDLAAWRGKLALREVIGAGEPLNPEIIEQVKTSWGLTLRDGYGQTETTAIIGNAPGLPVKPGSMGLPMPGYRIALLDAEGREADEGEVCLKLDDVPGEAPGGHPGTGRPLGLMAGYEDSPERTAEVMHGGYYRTGDVAQRDAQGYYTFVGRADDVFKASDYRISPFELESALIEHAAVVEVAVVPSPDPVRLAVPKAFIILTQGSAADRTMALDVLAFARQALAPYKRVRRIEFVTELPKTISGKIRRVELRQLEISRRERGTRDAGEYFEEDFPDLKS
ncbi:MAG: AMP-binding protein [Burkholderiales bacterium]|uniref:AMP-binding protein n=1 Tax=Ottowia pentelensis TaxID=511108 RepID=A0ABV6PR63_9BURK|nr:AMP-binding protein [Burkholderiales bacterium]MBS0403478.1 AMP-binding protein [Pseudomonadota bacterium]MBS0415745.1 AMP-binding protein [Pseudomonadota bacterium]